jgi:hypothetical protein
MKDKLLHYKHKDIDLFYSPEMKEEHQLNDEWDFNLVCERTVNDFLTLNKEHNELIEAYAKKNNLEGIAILMAHADTIDKKFRYYINDTKTPCVQSWINKMDGKYKALIMYACNPEADDIVTKKSPVLFPNNVYSGLKVMEGKVQIDLFLPKVGYVDPYMIGEEMEKLK